MHPQSSEAVQAIGAMLRALPKMQLLEGFNLKGRNSKSPDAHQLIATDMLVEPWLKPIFGEDKKRTRLILADEGGVGKTLTACLFIKRLLVSGIPDKNGSFTPISSKNPILILTPAANKIRRQWKRELESILLPEDFSQISMSKNQFLHANPEKSIYILSKYSVSNLFIDHNKSTDQFIQVLENKRSHSLKIGVTIVDEIHQGRSQTYSDLHQNEISENSSLWESQKALCTHSEYALGLSATPINMDNQELVRMLEVLGGECLEYAECIREKLDKNQIEEWKNITSILLECSNLIRKNKIPSEELLSSLSTQIQSECFPSTDTEKELISKYLIGNNWSLEEWGVKGPRLLRELHPLGRYLTLIRRADLGYEYCSDRFREMETENSHLKWDENLKGWFESNNLWLKKGTGTEIAHSWPWNAGHYKVLEKIDPPSLTLIQDDPRVKKLIGHLVQEIETQQSSKEMSGCVVFCQYLNTVNGISKFLEQWDSDNSLLILKATGDNENHDIDEALIRAERASKSGYKYPILVCTQVGDVGMDMEWATLGVHWDLGYNPQSVEQRGWRLDRRFSESVSRSFTLVRMLTDHPYHLHLHAKFDSILQNAQHILGLPDEAYVKYSPNSGITTRTWEKSILFSITGNEMNALMKSLGLNDKKINSKIIEMGVTAEKMMWEILHFCEIVPIDLELLEEGKLQILPSNDGRILDWDVHLQELVHTLRSDSLNYPQAEQTTISRLLSTPIHSQSNSRFECQQLVIANSKSDRDDACRSLITTMSKTFQNCLIEQGLDNSNINLNTIDLTSHGILGDDIRGKILIVNFNPDQKNLVQPSLFNGSLWLLSGKKCHRLKVSSENDVKILNNVLDEILFHLTEELDFVAARKINFAGLKNGLSQELLMQANNNSRQNRLFIRRLKRHLNPEKDDIENWPELEIQCLVEL